MPPDAQIIEGDAYLDSLVFSPIQAAGRSPVAQV